MLTSSWSDVSAPDTPSSSSSGFVQVLTPSMDRSVIALSDHNYDNPAEYHADISSNDQPFFMCSLAWTAMIWVLLTPLSTLLATRSLHVPNNANM
jgi:hypothetical protein